MAKFRVPVEKLPPPSNETGNHSFIFRVVSEDRSLISQYSTLYSVQSKGQIFPEEQSPEYVINDNVINVYWNVPSIYNVGASAVGASVMHNHDSEWKQHPSDIFVSWDEEDYEYYGRTIDNEMSIIKKSGATSVQIIGQVASYPPAVNSIFKIFETEVISLS